MARDIDYAAKAVMTALTEKFGRKADLQALDATANERTITIRDGQRTGEGTRDDLLSAIRAADTYDRLWESLHETGKTAQ